MLFKAKTFPFTSITSSQLASSVIAVTINGVSTIAYNISGANIIFNAPPAANASIIITATPEDFYRLGTVIYNDTTELQLMDRNEWYLIKKAPLVAPTTSYPACLFEDQKIYVYPTTIIPGVSTNNTSPIQVSYIKKPANVNWSSSPGNVGQLLYNPTLSTQFELHDSEQTNVILQILTYSGIILQDPNLVQMMAQQVQQEQINDKS